MTDTKTSGDTTPRRILGASIKGTKQEEWHLKIQRKICTEQATLKWPYLEFDPKENYTYEELDGPERFFLRKCCAWVPEYIYTRKRTPMIISCFHCDEPVGGRSKWKTVECIGQENTFYLMCLEYTCGSCSMRFTNADPQFLKKYDVHIAMELPVVLHGNSGVDRGLLTMLYWSWVEMGPTAVTRTLSRCYLASYEGKQLSYLSQMLMRHEAMHSADTDGNGIAPRQLDSRNKKSQRQVDQMFREINNKRKVIEGIVDIDKEKQLVVDHARSLRSAAQRKLVEDIKGIGKTKATEVIDCLAEHDVIVANVWDLACVQVNYANLHYDAKCRLGQKMMRFVRKDGETDASFRARCVKNATRAFSCRSEFIAKAQGLILEGDRQQAFQNFEALVRLLKDDDQRLKANKAAMEKLLAETKENSEAMTASDESSNSIPPPDANSIPEFGLFDDRKRYNGILVSESRLRGIFEAHFADKKSHLIQWISNEYAGASISVDTTFSLAQRIKVTLREGSHVNAKYALFGNALTLVGSDGKLLYMVFRNAGSGENWEDVNPALATFRDNQKKLHNDDSNWLKLAATDKCCGDVNKIRCIFGPLVSVKQDIFHWMRRFAQYLALRPQHPLVAEFWKQFSCVVFVADESDELNNVHLPGDDRSVRAKVQLKRKRGKIACRVPEPDILKERLTNFFTQVELNASESRQHNLTMEETFKRRCIEANVDYKTLSEDAKVRKFQGFGLVLQPVLLKEDKFGRGILYYFQHVQLKHVENGCLSDPADIAMYTQHDQGTSKTNVRGTNRNEGIHRLLNEALGGSSATPGLQRAECVILEFMVQHNANIDDRIHNRGFLQHKYASKQAMLDINSYCKKLNMNLPFPNIIAPLVQPTPISPKADPLSNIRTFCFQKIQLGVDQSNQIPILNFEKDPNGQKQNEKENGDVDGVGGHDSDDEDAQLYVVLARHCRALENGDLTLDQNLGGGKRRKPDHDTCKLTFVPFRSGDDSLFEKKIFYDLLHSDKFRGKSLQKGSLEVELFTKSFNKVVRKLLAKKGYGNLLLTRSLTGLPQDTIALPQKLFFKTGSQILDYYRLYNKYRSKGTQQAYAQLRQHTLRRNMFGEICKNQLVFVPDKGVTLPPGYETLLQKVSAETLPVGPIRGTYGGSAPLEVMKGNLRFDKSNFHHAAPYTTISARQGFGTIGADEPSRYEWDGRLICSVCGERKAHHYSEGSTLKGFGRSCKATRPVVLSSDEDDDLEDAVVRRKLIDVQKDQHVKDIDDSLNNVELVPGSMAAPLGESERGFVAELRAKLEAMMEPNCNYITHDGVLQGFFKLQLSVICRILAVKHWSNRIVNRNDQVHFRAANYLNDEAVSGYIRSLYVRFQARTPSNDFSFTLVDSVVMGNCLKEWEITKSSAQMVKYLLARQRKNPALVVPDRNLFVKDLVLFPVNMNENHWVLVAFFPKWKQGVYRLELFDSLGTAVALLEKVKSVITSAMENESVREAFNVPHSSTFSWDCPVETRKLVMQQNGYDCGPLVCACTSIILEIGLQRGKIGYETWEKDLMDTRTAFLRVVDSSHVESSLPSSMSKAQILSKYMRDRVAIEVLSNAGNEGQYQVV